jgi:hypothetical protein
MLGGNMAEPPLGSDAPDDVSTNAERSRDLSGLGAANSLSKAADGLRDPDSLGAADSLSEAADGIRELTGESAAERVLNAVEMRKLTGQSAAERLFNAAEMQKLTGQSAAERLFNAAEMQKLTGQSAAERLFNAAEMRKLTGQSAAESVLNAARLRELTGQSMADSALKAAASVREMAGLGIGDDLKNSFERTARLSASLGDALAHLRPLPVQDFHFAPPELPYIEPPRNPIFETNKELAELTRTTRDLVGLAQNQAELSQSLAETSRLALAETVRSGEQAKRATQLAAAGIIITVVIAAGTIFYNYIHNQAAEAHLQHEIQVLNEISRQQRAADGHGQEEVSALGEILGALQNPKNAAPAAPPHPSRAPAAPQKER